ncbi:MAG: hypothetical protein WCA22_01035 [Candidatus Binatus sp.]
MLYLYGSYEEMGREEARLLGQTAIDAETLYGDHWKGLLARMGVGVKIADTLWLPVLSWTEPLYEQSGMFAESVGISRSWESREPIRFGSSTAESSAVRPRLWPWRSRD